MKLSKHDFKGLVLIVTLEMRVSSIPTLHPTGNTSPSSLFLLRLSSVKDFNYSISCGIESESLLQGKQSFSQAFYCPISPGIESESLLESRSRLVKAVNYPISGGIEPESLLESRSRLVKAVNYPISGGIEPESWVPESLLP